MAVPGKKASKELLSSSDDDLTVYCQPCDRDGPRLPAFGYCTNCNEHLCETCFMVHQRHTLSKTHKLLEEGDMPETLSPVIHSQKVNRQIEDNLKQPCPNHQNKVIEFFCHDHKTFLCSVCTILDHPKTSCDVGYVPELSADIVDSKEYQNILRAIDDMTEKYKRKFEHLETQTEKLDNSLELAMTELKEIRVEINKRLDKLEKDTKNAAMAIQLKNSISLKKFKASYEEVSKSLAKTSETINNLNKLKQADKLFMQIKEAEQMITDYGQTIQQVKTNGNNEYKFEPNEVVSRLLHKETSLGILKAKPLRPQRPPNRTQSRKISNVGTICVKTLNDKSLCFITGMTLLNPDLLVIVDQGNSSIKMVDITKKSVTDELTLDEKPLAISSVSYDEVVVTTSASLLFVSASTKKLVKRHTLNVHGGGVCCHQDKMVVLSAHPDKVQILEMSGNILATVQNENVFTGMGFVTACSSCIYVCDSRINSITKLDWLGNVVSKYVCKGEPRGLTMSNDDNVFVSDWRNNVIVEVQGDCSEKKVIVKADLEPFAVCWCAQTNTMYISSCSLPNNKRDNFLQIFKVLKQHLSQ